MSLGRTSIDLSLPHFLPWDNCFWLSSVLFRSKKLKISIVQDGGCHNIESKKMVRNTNTRKWKHCNKNGIFQMYIYHDVISSSDFYKNKDTTLILERMMSLYHWLYSIMVFLLMKISTKVIVGSPPKIFCVHWNDNNDI